MLALAEEFRDNAPLGGRRRRRSSSTACAPASGGSSSATTPTPRRGGAPTPADAYEPDFMERLRSRGIFGGIQSAADAATD